MNFRIGIMEESRAPSPAKSAGSGFQKHKL
jgi:hypothetical protein